MRLRKGPALFLCLVVGIGLAVADEVPTAWQLLDDGDPSPKDGTLAYDSWRQRLVRTTSGGGEDGPPFTWELTGEDWVRRFIPEPTPWGAGGACSAFDSDRGVVVLFGGVTGSTISETWEYDGTTWTQRFPADSPPPRYNCSLVYDAAHQRAVLFGGFSTGFSGLGDTWQWDGTDWTEFGSHGSPSARGWAELAYDSDRELVVLFGGRNGNTVFGETWEYDGQNHKWRQKNPAVSPRPRMGPGMTYDPVRQKTVLFGGSTQVADFDDTWEWDGASWTHAYSGPS